MGPSKCIVWIELLKALAQILCRGMRPSTTTHNTQHPWQILEYHLLPRQDIEEDAARINPQP